MESKTEHSHTYQVKDWNAYFEGAKSRTYNNKTSCQMPTKHGLGYKNIVRRKNGAAIFGAWCAMVQVLSRHPKDREGWVTDNGRKDGRPYTAQDLATLTDIPESVFSDMFQVCASYEVSWLKDTTGNYKILQDTIVPLHSDLDLDLDSDSDSKPKTGYKPTYKGYGELQKVKLTDEEYQALQAKHPADRLARAIEILDGYIASKGDKYKNHYAVFKKDSWVWDKVDEKMGVSSKPNMESFREAKAIPFREDQITRVREHEGEER